MPGGQILLLLLLLAGLAGAAGQGQEWDLGGSDASVIAVPNGGPWGDWAWPDMCPKGSYASGVSFKVQPPRQSPQPVRGPWSHGELTPHLRSLAGRGAPGGDGGRHGAQRDSAALLPQRGSQWRLHSRVPERQVSPRRSPSPPRGCRASFPAASSSCTRRPRRRPRHRPSSLFPRLGGATGRRPAGAPTEGAWWASRCGSSLPSAGS